MTDSYGATHVGALPPDIDQYVPGRVGMWSVSPVIDRPAARVWRVAFIHAAEADPIIEWMGAGFAVCAPDDAERVAERLVELVEETNEKFPAALAPFKESETSYVMDRGSAYYSADGEHFRNRRFLA
ncbi:MULTISPECIES: hypothetical protein [unclassified Nocardioides]|uniref:hypothetical protein n=1 Tax=unclassified Nocardioides TaxID=2615069 RepID=UPI0012E3EBB0|nr:MULTISPECIES: hypothetical protein [unclassified Nocardioides]